MCTQQVFLRLGRYINGNDVRTDDGREKITILYTHSTRYSVMFYSRTVCKWSDIECNSIKQVQSTEILLVGSSSIVGQAHKHNRREQRICNIRPNWELE